jgi:hypothetical protein
LTSFRLPNTITAHDGKICLACDLMHFNVRQWCYCLFVELKSHVLLVGNIANSSWKI